jgi:hypothetical protein
MLTIMRAAGFVMLAGLSCPALAMGDPAAADINAAEFEANAEQQERKAAGLRAQADAVQRKMDAFDRQQAEAGEGVVSAAKQGLAQRLFGGARGVLQAGAHAADAAAGIGAMNARNSDQLAMHDQLKSLNQAASDADGEARQARQAATTARAIAREQAAKAEAAERARIEAARVEAVRLAAIRAAQERADRDRIRLERDMKEARDMTERFRRKDIADRTG